MAKGVINKMNKRVFVQFYYIFPVSFHSCILNAASTRYVVMSAQTNRQFYYVISSSFFFYFLWNFLIRTTYRMHLSGYRYTALCVFFLQNDANFEIKLLLPKRVCVCVL
uniref:Uncharacterized protein n=1 Tax=Sipha flava TaxID=143950 RepID=A0A2S2R0V1_9HEMI